MNHPPNHPTTQQPNNTTNQLTNHTTIDTSNGPANQRADSYRAGQAARHVTPRSTLEDSLNRTVFADMYLGGEMGCAGLHALYLCMYVCMDGWMDV